MVKLNYIKLKKIFADYKQYGGHKHPQMPSQPLHNAQQQLSMHSNHKSRVANVPNPVAGGQNAHRQMPLLQHSDPHHRIARPGMGMLSSTGHAMPGAHKIPTKVDPRMQQKDLRGSMELAPKATGNTNNPNMYGNTSSNKMFPTSLSQYNANTNHTPAFASNNTALHMNPKVESTNDAIRNAMQGNRNSYGNTVSNLVLFDVKLIYLIITITTIYSNYRDSHNVIL